MKNNLEVDILNSAVKKIIYDAIHLSYYPKSNNKELKKTKNLIEICRYKKDLV